MTGTGLTDLPVRNLEHLFTPPGLPLVSKSDGAAATTSILIRGGAGTGKTTLGAALGQAIARRESGVVLYLTTEFSQTELLYKAKLLGLAEDMVFRWKDRAAAPPGAIVTEHLALTPAGQGPLTSLERKAGSIEALWDLLHPESGPLDITVRAVVIDAFTLPDATVEEKTLRSDLVAFVQALEGEGISTVIVEEATEERTSWLPFVVDLVFEIAWVADPDSADLHRKLRCSKSRYAQALAGPHDYGLDMGVPAVWPDLLAVASSLAGRSLDVKRPAALVLPFHSSTPAGPRYVRFVRGGVALFERGNFVARFLKVIPMTRGVVIAVVRCGPLNMVYGEYLSTPIQVPDSEGAQSLAWVLVHAIRTHGVNVVVFHDPEALLRRQRFAIPLLHVLEGLRRLGTLVIVHAQGQHVEALSSIADFGTNGNQGHAREPNPLPSMRLRRADIWATNIPDVNPIDIIFESPVEGLDALRSALKRAREQVLEEDVKSARVTLTHMRTNVVGTLAGHILIASGCVLQQIGLTESALGRIAAGALLSGGVFASELAWMRALAIPDDVLLFELMDNLSAHPTSRAWELLWSSLCAVYAGSDAALASLRQLAGAPEERIIIGYLLRALARRGLHHEVRTTAGRYGYQYSVSDWLVTRMIEEAMLEAPSNSDRQQAYKNLALLQDNEVVPRLHRADIAHNLGAVREESKESDAAVRWYQKALDLNPFLEVSRLGLTRLGAVAPPAP